MSFEPARTPSGAASGGAEPRPQEGGLRTDLAASGSRSLIWVLDPRVERGTVEDVLAGLAAKGVTAHARDLPAGRAVVIDDPPADLAVPAGVVRTASVEIPAEDVITRRAFVEAFAAALALAVIGAGAGVAASFATPPEGRREDLAEIEAASFADLKVKRAIRFRFGREPCILLLVRDRVHALSLVCTHLGCLVDWSADRQQLICPCHKASFDVLGNVVEGPPPRPLISYDVNVEGDRVLVRRRTA